MDDCGERNVNYHEPNSSSDWQVHGNDVLSSSIGMILAGDSMVERPCSSSAPMLNSFCPPMWDQSADGLSLGYCGINVENGVSMSGNVRTGMDWAPNVMFRGGMGPFVAGMQQPQSLPPHVAADSAFIERAARFSCFGGGSFSGMMNSFGILDPLSCRGSGPEQMQLQLQQHEMNLARASNDPSLPAKGESIMRGNEEAKIGVGALSNESNEAGFSGRDAPEELNRVVGLSPGKGLGSKKRKRDAQGAEQRENDEAQPSADTEKETSETKQKDDQNSKPGGKHGKPGSSGLPKEEYIHVRARRGQATNSHSLAERVRREKISERMKFLQDLVPGCNKVTGKAVMLDEIINYVQSLQRQVEFLSMKLATVNPRLDFNIEQLLSKDSPQARAALSLSPAAFPPHITAPFPSLHPSAPGLIPAGFPGNSSETLRGQISLPGSMSQVWEDELHNIVHMGINTSTSAPLIISQDSSGSQPPPDRMKPEL